jgi:hypothetical protein
MMHLNVVNLPNTDQEVNDHLLTEIDKFSKEVLKTVDSELQRRLVNLGRGNDMGLVEKKVFPGLKTKDTVYSIEGDVIMTVKFVGTKVEII